MNPRARKFWGKGGRGSSGELEGAILCEGDLPRRRKQSPLPTLERKETPRAVPGRGT